MPLATGTRLGPYEILAPIGAGGMGEVYRARDLKLDRDVALKVLPESMASDATALARFEREAKAVAALSHPNILAIHDFGLSDATSYAVMELLEGDTLRVLLAHGAIPVRKVVEYGAQIAQGLAAAHQKGIIHRDLKPDNVFVTRDGRVKILDFGLARQPLAGAMGDDSDSPTASRHTEPGAVLGTVGYMSPEQVRGQTADPRSDIFSLGFVVYEMLSGQRAFLRETGAETMAAILREDPPPLPEDQRQVPPALERIIGHCLEKKPEERFQSARDVAFDLASLSGSSAERTAQALPAQRHLTHWAWLGVALAMGVAIGAVLGRALRPAVRPASAPRATFTQLTDLPAVEDSPRPSPDGKTIIFASRASGNSDIYSQRVGGHNPINLTRDCPKDDTEPAFSPDGGRIAFYSECGGGGIFVMGATGESRRRVTDFGHDPAWSPDGRQIAVASEPTKSPLSRVTESRLWVVDVATGAKRLLSESDAMQPSWSPHGQRIAYWGLRGQGGQRDLWTIPVEGGPPVDVTNDEAVDWDPVWSPDGRWLYFSSSRGGSMNLWRIGVDEATGRVSGRAEPLTTPAAWSGQISVARDGRQIAYATRDERSSLFRVSFDPVRGVLVGAPKAVLAGSRVVSTLSLSPDGQWIAFTNKGAQEDLFVVRVDGSEYRQLTDDPALDRLPPWSPDGTRIAFFSNRGGRYEIWVIRPDGSSLERLVASSQGSTIVPNWSPDGRSLSVVQSAPPPRSYIVQAGRPVEDPTTRLLPPIPGGLGFWATSWSPDGGRLAGIGLREDGRVTGIFAYSLASASYEKLISSEPSFQLDPWPIWLADGRHVTYVEKGGLFLLDSLSRQSHQLLPLGTLIAVAGRTFAFSKDNHTLVYTSTATEGDVWLMTLE